MRGSRGRGGGGEKSQMGIGFLKNNRMDPFLREVSTTLCEIW